MCTMPRKSSNPTAHTLRGCRGPNDPYERTYSEILGADGPNRSPSVRLAWALDGRVPYEVNDWVTNLAKTLLAVGGLAGGSGGAGGIDGGGSGAVEARRR